MPASFRDTSTGNTFLVEYSFISLLADSFNLNSESRLKQPDILYGRTGQELPCIKICSMLNEVIAVDTGPDGGLTTVNRGKKKHLTSQDPSLSYIDSEEEPVAPPRESKHLVLFLDDFSKCKINIYT